MMYGAELELPDVDTRVVLPPHIGKWDEEDFTIVNSNGIANDPKKRLVCIGSEVNMTPTNTVDELVSNIEELYTLVDTKTNHKSNLHVHVSIEGITEDAELLKKLIKYTFKNEEFIMSRVDPLPSPTTELMAMRMKHLKKSHQQRYPDSYKKRILAATTPTEIMEAFQPMKNGRRLTHLVKRCGINIRSLWDNGTIEFRHFFGTDNIEEYRNAIEWCDLYVKNALGEQKEPEELLAMKDWKFATMAEWNEELQLGWEYTNLEKNKRTEVKERLLEKGFEIPVCL